MSSTVLLEAAGLAKAYPGVQALDDVSLDVRRGEIHALVGENGAGKSTLIRLLAGVDRPDAGEVRINGEAVRLSSPAEARRLGVAVIFQELAVVPWMTVAENIVLGREPGRGPGGIFVDRHRAAAQATAILDRMGVAIDPGAPVGTLSIAEQQLVEIARALATESQILIMDEPTSSLGVRDVRALLDVVTGLRDSGVGIVYVSHKLDEIREIADRITVMRNGRRVAALPTGQVGSEELIRLMVGRDESELYPPSDRTFGDTVLQVTGLTRHPAFADISLEVRAGEVLGIAGLVGAGRTEVVRAICGIDQPDAGEIRIDGRPVRFRTVADAISAGIVYAPEDRKQLGLVLGMSSHENAALPSLGRFMRGGLLRWPRLRSSTEAVLTQVGIRGQLTPPVRTLSGGNQQKVVLGRWIMRGAKVYVLDEPTRGIDIGAKAEVYGLIRSLCAQGAAVIVVSSELEELRHLADRIIVMSAGRVQDTLNADEYDEERVLQAAFARNTVHHVHASSDPRISSDPDRTISIDLDVLHDDKEPA